MVALQETVDVVPSDLLEGFVTSQELQALEEGVVLGRGIALLHASSVQCLGSLSAEYFVVGAFEVPRVGRVAVASVYIPPPRKGLGVQAYGLVWE